MKKPYDYIAELFPWSPDDFPARPRTKRVLRKLIREALIEAVNAGINQSNGAAVIERIAKRMVP